MSRFKLGIVELFSEERRFSDQELEELAAESFKFAPLGEIFSLDYIDGVRESTTIFNTFKTGLEVLRIKLNNGLSAICVVKENILPMAPSTVEDINSIVYSNVEPRVLAHELGHFLGLKHPAGELCNISCKGDEKCYAFNYVMCQYGDGTKNFQPHELKILEKYINR